MRYAPSLLLLVSSTSLLVAGCASDRQYYAAAPPPPPSAYYGQPSTIDVAEHEGLRAGADDGARDAYEGRRYSPQHDRRFHDTPGYDPRLGPYEAYRDAFRDGYLHGYANGYRRQ